MVLERLKRMVRLEVKRTYFLLDRSKQILLWNPSAEAYLPRTHLLTMHNASSCPVLPLQADSGYNTNLRSGWQLSLATWKVASHWVEITVTIT